MDYQLVIGYLSREVFIWPASKKNVKQRGLLTQVILDLCVVVVGQQKSQDVCVVSLSIVPWNPTVHSSTGVRVGSFASSLI